MQVSPERVLDIVSVFVSQKKGPGRQIAWDTPLLQQGHLDSFALIELIGELEKSLQITLPDGALIPEDFETPRVLCDRLIDI